jgi:thiamine phosphate synthase YjbQ (UPF0047 family)
MIFLKNYYINTTAEIDFLPATHDVKYAVRDAQAKNGLVTVIVPGPGASVALFEPAEGLIDEFRAVFEAFGEGENKGKDKRGADVYLTPRVQAMMLGRTLSIPLKDGRLVMSPYDEIYLIDFNKKAQRREYTVQIMSEDAKETAPQARQPAKKK